MDKSTGRLIFVGAIWVYSLIYYLQCLGLEDMSDKVAIIVVFWIMTVFTAVEIIRQFREFLNRDKSAAKLGIMVLVKDKKFQLIAALVIYLVLLNGLGYYTSSFLAFCAFSYILGNRGFVKTVIPGVIVLIAIHLIFVTTLKLTLPQGILI